MRPNLRRKIRDGRGEENKGEVKTKGKGKVREEKSNEERTGCTRRPCPVVARIM